MVGTKKNTHQRKPYKFTFVEFNQNRGKKNLQNNIKTPSKLVPTKWFLFIRFVYCWCFDANFQQQQPNAIA